MKNQRITTVAFDADDTLWEWAKATRRALSITLAELRRLLPHTPDSLTVETVVDIREQVDRELRGRVIDVAAVRVAGFKRMLQHVGVSDDELAVHLSALYSKHRDQNMELFDDTIPTLDALQSRYKLGIISNGASDPKMFGLEDRFQFVIFSINYGVEKPNPRIFDIAMNQAGCTADQLIYVGDKLETDVEGANQAGVTSIWLNRRGGSNDTNIRPNFEIGALTEVVGISEKLG